MSHTPYGYKIVDGRAVVDKEQAAVVRTFFEGYISGLALTAAAEKAGLKIYHGSAGRMLRNKHYLGDQFYSAIIDEETYAKAEEIRMQKAKSLGRVRELTPPPKPMAGLQFSMPEIEQKYLEPYQQAEYAYSQIESEADAHGGR